MEKFLEYAPQIITAAAKDPLGIVALVVLVLSVIGILFFRDASVKVRIVMYVLMFFGFSGFAVLAFQQAGPVVAQKDFEEAMGQADAALNAKQYTAAIDHYERAREIMPDNWKPYHGLGRTTFRQGRYTLSLDHFKTAYEKEGETDGSIAYAMSMAQDGLEQYEEAEQSLLLAEKLLPRDSGRALEVTFDLGLMGLLMWLNHDAPEDSQRYRGAELAFQNFLDREGSPRQWVNYHLGCLKATRTEDSSLAEITVAQFQDEAIGFLESAVLELASYRSDKAAYQRDIMRDLLQTPETWFRKPGEPVACPALIRVWTAQRGPINTLLARLR